MSFLFNSLLRMHTQKHKLCVHCFVKHQDFSVIYLLIFTVVACASVAAASTGWLLCRRNIYIFLRYKVQLKFNKDMLKLSKFKIVEAYSNLLSLSLSLSIFLCCIMCLSEVSMECGCGRLLQGFVFVLFTYKFYAMPTAM